MKTYFAYGSNLSKERKTKRKLSLELISVAYLDSYEICFPQYSELNKGGVASFRACPGARLYGALYRASDDDIAKLDLAEGYRLGRHENEYERIEIQVKNLDNQDITCLTYLATDDHSIFFKPSAEYLKLITDGLSDLVSFGMPNSYVDQVKKVNEIS